MVGYQEINLKPGQFIFGRLKASKELKMSQQTIRTCVQSLTKCENLTIKSTNKFSIISITNWERYQTEEIENNQLSNQQLTSNQPATNQQLTTNNNINNIKKVKNINKTPLESPLKGQSKIPPDFKITDDMRVWFSEQNFKTIKIDSATAQFVDYWKSTGKQMIDWVATWRNGMRNREKWNLDKKGPQPETTRYVPREHIPPIHEEP